MDDPGSSISQRDSVVMLRGSRCDDRRWVVQAGIGSDSKSVKKVRSRAAFKQKNISSEATSGTLQAAVSVDWTNRSSMH